MSTHRRLTLPEQLRAAGFRVTPPRLAIAEYLEKAHQPVGTRKLIEVFVPEVLDMATLYRTVKSFHDKGLVQQLSLERDFASYEWIHEGEEHHHHLVCTRCGATEEIAECHLKPLEKQVLEHAKRFKSIVSHSLEFFGRCTACTRRA